MLLKLYITCTFPILLFFYILILCRKMEICYILLWNIRTFNIEGLYGLWSQNPMHKEKWHKVSLLFTIVIYACLQIYQTFLYYLIQIHHAWSFLSHESSIYARNVRIFNKKARSPTQLFLRTRVVYTFLLINLLKFMIFFWNSFLISLIYSNSQNANA